MRLAILGSTGSIGRQALAVISEFARVNPDYRDQVEVVGLAALRQAKLLAEQVETFHPRICVLVDANAEGRELLAAACTASSSSSRTRLLLGAEALIELVTRDDVDMVLVAVVGSAGLKPTLAALRAGKRVALANKETLVVGGELVRRMLGRRALAGDRLRPIDSEHSAIWQCLGTGTTEGGPDRQSPSCLRRLILTASGGPLRNLPLDRFPEVTAAQVLAHPTWRMGPRITVDSATLMNKGFEVIEACYLFGVPDDKVEVVVHPQSVVHSLVEFVDRSVLAQLGWPDMRLPIQYALFYPHRYPSDLRPLDLTAAGRLEFYPVEADRYPCLGLARMAGRLGSTYPAVLNAADEEAVAAFLAGEIRFTDIPGLVERVLARHQPVHPDELSEETILAADSWSRRTVRSMIRDLARKG
ncbi:MAG: 1-deoxy-D-xylulose-5-phosphate reductoisomerase [Limnochordales bacterium]|nr:1-deoxy-D-xylulose-5-phosphate reductoisomerase [Limnochordales bacterium]